MLNIQPKHILLICNIIWINKTCGEYISKSEQTRFDSYTLQDEYKSYKWAHVNIYPVKSENVKTEKNVNTKNNSRE